MAEPRPRVWLVSKEHVGPRPMGPVVRLFGQARQAAAAGYDVTIVCPGWEAPALDGVEAVTDPRTLLARWRPGDPVVVDAYIPGRWLFALLASRIPFDADFYCVSIPESAEDFPRRDDGWRRRERIRRTFKYGWIAETARRLYVSNAAQTLSLAGMIASGPDNRSARLVGRLPARCLELPMGTRNPSLPVDPPHPYPTPLQGRPIALWGGGIWPWFDMETLLQAFSRIQDRDRGPALFFLAGSNNRPDALADTPIERARSRAAELGLLDRNVFFNRVPVGPDELGPWLHHASMGVMANPDSWEARVSWRTRYLDLLDSGTPLVVAGSDPLAERLAAAGGAVLVPCGDAAALAAAIGRVASDPDLRRNLSQGMRAASASVAQERLGATWIASLAADDWSPRPAAPVGILRMVRFRLGL